MKKYRHVLQVGGFVKTSVVDGPGIRQVLFVSGCRLCCPGCHNPELQSYNFGERMSLIEVLGLFSFDGKIDKVTFSGGEPMDQPKALAELAVELRKNGINDIIIYSGYTIEELLMENDIDRMRLLGLCNTFIDGRFDINKKDISLPFRGSGNQRMIKLGSYLKRYSIS